MPLSALTRACSSAKGYSGGDLRTTTIATAYLGNVESIDMLASIDVALSRKLLSFAAMSRFAWRDMGLWQEHPITRCNYDAYPQRFEQEPMARAFGTTEYLDSQHEYKCSETLE